MPAAVIQASYDDLAAFAGQFSEQAQAVQHLIEQAARLQSALQSGGWTGMGAEAFFAEMGDLVFPAMRRLSSALDDARDVVARISGIFHDAEEEASRQFEGDGAAETSGGGFFSDLFGFGAGSKPSGGTGQGWAADITKYQNGVDGWSLVSVDGSQGFRPNELLVQKGDTCAIYAALNLLVANGYDISQDTADPFANITKMQEAWWRPDMWLDDNPNWGFGMGVSEDVAEKWASKVQRGDFEDEPLKAEQFLIKSVQGGTPVMVLMEMDDSFGGSGGHFATVLGTKTDTDGRLSSVLVATNWGGSPIMEIPAGSFMDDWMGRNDGEYMTVNRKPPPPKQPGEGFSRDLLEELNKQGWK